MFLFGLRPFGGGSLLASSLEPCLSSQDGGFARCYTYLCFLVICLVGPCLAVYNSYVFHQMLKKTRQRVCPHCHFVWQTPLAKNRLVAFQDLFLNRSFLGLCSSSFELFMFGFYRCFSGKTAVEPTVSRLQFLLMFLWWGSCWTLRVLPNAAGAAGLQKLYMVGPNMQCFLIFQGVLLEVFLLVLGVLLGHHHSH